MTVTVSTSQDVLAERLQIMAAGIGGEVGQAFLRKLVATLRDAMEAEWALITVGEGAPPTRARAILALGADGPEDNIEYELEGTPCHQVYQGRTLVIPDKLADRFSKEEGLAGFVGVPIRDERGVVSGHIAVFSRVPIVTPDAAEAIVRIFGARVEADRRLHHLVQERDELISELLRANETLVGRNQAMHDANQSKSMLMGIVAHDLRNPLAAIIAQTELLQTVVRRNGVERDKILTRLGKIMSNADRLASLIEATLNRCRTESGKIVLKRRRVDLSALIQAAIETNASEARRKRIALIHEGPAALWVEIDDSLFLEAIDNLISNAIKYSHPGKEVRLSLQDDGASVTFAVEDQGQGLSDGDMSRVFMPFQKLSSLPTSGEVSTGLGLANVRAIAEAHGGTSSVVSGGKGLGATFSVTIPTGVDR